MMKAVRLKLSAIVGLALLCSTAVNGQTWPGLLQSIRKRFPAVRQLSTAELADWLKDAGRAKPILVDVRAAEEFAVSHLQGAINSSSAEAIIKSATPSAPVVLYCSVGYRSSALAQKMLKAGFTNVFNLEGSIFRWVNEGRPVYRSSQQLKPPQVHPYSAKWGKLLTNQTVILTERPLRIDS